MQTNHAEGEPEQAKSDSHKQAIGSLIILVIIMGIMNILFLADADNCAKKCNAHYQKVLEERCPDLPQYIPTSPYVGNLTESLGVVE